LRGRYQSTKAGMMGSSLTGLSDVATVAGVAGENTAGGEGVHGQAHGPEAGVAGFNDSAQGGPGVWGESQHGEGMHGISHATFAGVGGYNDSAQGGAGVWGESQHGEGVHGISHATFAGVTGVNDNPQGGPGVWGDSQHGEGVRGISHAKFAGVTGVNDNAQGGPGLWGESQHGEGVHGISHATLAGVTGVNDNPQGGPGVWGDSQHGEGVHAVCHNAKFAALSAENTAAGGLAGYFHGHVVVQYDCNVFGDVKLMNAGDIAEDFDAARPDLDPGTVVCIGDDESVRPCTREYDGRVVGVISGAGELKPGVVLGGECSQQSRSRIALTGRVYCLVDAGSAPIRPGDQLTTSSTPGYAMRAAPHRSAGAVLGKALRALPEGRGLIPILVTLQ
jgi:hypothetical protein